VLSRIFNLVGAGWFWNGSHFLPYILLFPISTLTFFFFLFPFFFFYSSSQDLPGWYQEMPKIHKISRGLFVDPSDAPDPIGINGMVGVGIVGDTRPAAGAGAASKRTIDQYYASQQCVVCGRDTQNGWLRLRRSVQESAG
jgi:hypothetical protein